jgi:hypothetical protein
MTGLRVSIDEMDIDTRYEGVQSTDGRSPYTIQSFPNPSNFWVWRYQSKRF